MPVDQRSKHWMTMSHMFHALCVCGEGWEGGIRGRWERKGDEGGKGYGMKGRRGGRIPPAGGRTPLVPSL